MTLADQLKKYHVRTGASHYHSSLSVLPVLEWVKERMVEGDVCLLSKAHAITAYKLVFETLPERPPVQNEFGSLGTALPYAIGVAYMRPKNKVYVVMGDGEWDSGANHEAYRMMLRLNMHNVIMCIDYNEMQGMGNTVPQWPNDPLRIRAFPTTKGPHWSCHYANPT